MNVQLTIDMNLQAILETELDNAFRAAGQRTGIIVDPNSGEILAMTSRPSFMSIRLTPPSPKE